MNNNAQIPVANCIVGLYVPNVGSLTQCMRYSTLINTKSSSWLLTSVFFFYANKNLETAEMLFTTINAVDTRWLFYVRLIEVILFQLPGS